VNDDTGVMGPYAYGQGNWVGYDDAAMATRKVDYIISNKIGGAIIWDISNRFFNFKPLLYVNFYLN